MTQHSSIRSEPSPVRTTIPAVWENLKFPRRPLTAVVSSSENSPAICSSQLTLKRPKAPPALHPSLLHQLPPWGWLWVTLDQKEPAFLFFFSANDPFVFGHSSSLMTSVHYDHWAPVIRRIYDQTARDALAIVLSISEKDKQQETEQVWINGPNIKVGQKGGNI